MGSGVEEQSRHSLAQGWPAEQAEQQRKAGGQLLPGISPTHSRTPPILTYLLFIIKPQKDPCPFGFFVGAGYCLQLSKDIKVSRCIIGWTSEGSLWSVAQCGALSVTAVQT